MTYSSEPGAVHCRRDFWEDVYEGLQTGHKFHKDVYRLFKLVHHLLEYGESRSDNFKTITAQQDWIFFDVKNWSDFSRIVRLVNKI